ncbi:MULTISPECIES: hypothetical protein [Clostridium]|uniref:M20 family metallopeptidase n=1 Tax=Clostridium senegalense TaxID=1465809 RepID=A0A6M0H058_9CLOT|nr:MULTISPECIES: hypothetical protein [Clostridium]NEU03959.1 M20 family metallopeptidase [Clostridium senegalense]
MKQNVISYLSTIKNEILSINSFLYNNPEKPFHEYNSCKYLINILRKHDFNITENFLDINTAFKATYGQGYPKICYICKYSAHETLGHIYGNNSNAAISIGAGIALKEILNKMNGTIIIIGCPGLYSNGSEIKMTHENVFEDADLIIAPHVDNTNSESGTSMASIPLKIDYTLNKTDNRSLEFSLFNLQSLNQIVKSSCDKCYIDKLNIDINNKIQDKLINETFKFHLKSPCIKEAETIEHKIRSYFTSLESMLDIKYNVCLYELPCKQLISNTVLSRIFSHNLKECGIINIDEPKTMEYSLGIGTISHTTPTIYPSISITDDTSIHCPSTEFKDSTLLELSCKRILLAAQCIAITSIDFLEREDLLKEITVNHYNNIKK